MLLVALAGGCAAQKATTLSADQRPRTEATASSTNFQGALRCLDGLLAGRNAPTTDILVGSMPDATGKLPLSLRDMTIHAISEANRRSGAYRVIDIASIPWLQVTALQTGSPYPITQTPNLPPTSLNITGSIVNVSQALYSENASAGAGLSGSPQGNIGVSYVAQLGSVETGMRLSRFGTHEVLYTSQHQLTLRQNSLSVDGRAGFADYGASVGLSFDRQDSPAKAVQTLIDLHVIELLGKHASVPYWTCLSRKDTAPAFHQKASDDWRGGSDKTAFMRTALKQRGYDGAFASALQAFQLDHGLPPSGRPNFETYLALKGDEAGGSGPTPGRGPTLSLKASNIGPTWRVEVGVSKSAHVSCYYRSDDGVVARIHPNPFNPVTQVSATAQLFVPDALSERNFLIQAQSPRFLCLAAGEDPGPGLPDGLRGPAFADLSGAGYGDFRAIRDAYAGVAPDLAAASWPN
ncbi:MAG: hypothetical protein AAFR52_02610 [Pseudomonadota bacterium]